jgi:hypothetical protein
MFRSHVENKVWGARSLQLPHLGDGDEFSRFMFTFAEA